MGSMGRGRRPAAFLGSPPSTSARGMKVLMLGSRAYARAATSARRGKAWLMKTRGAAHARTPPAAAHARRLGCGLITPQPGRTTGVPCTHSSGKRAHAARFEELALSRHASVTRWLGSSSRFSPRRHGRSPANPGSHSQALSGSDGPAYHSSPQRCPVDPQKLNSFLDPSAVSTYECSQVRHAGRAVAPHTRFGTKELRRQPKRKVLPLLGLPSRKRLGSSRLLAAHA